MPIRDVALMTYQKQWTVGRGGGRKSGISVLMAQLNEDDDELFEIELFFCIKMDLALNNLQRVICHKTQTNKQTKRKDLKFFKKLVGKIQFLFLGKIKISFK